MDETRKIPRHDNNDNQARTIILLVYQALKEKGYNPISQMVGYILSGDRHISQAITALVPLSGK